MAWISRENAPSSGLGARLDQIGNRLRLSEIELVVEKGAAGEFTGLREP
jgi:hypothetical protein